MFEGLVAGPCCRGGRPVALSCARVSLVGPGTSRGPPGACFRAWEVEALLREVKLPARRFERQPQREVEDTSEEVMAGETRNGEPCDVRDEPQEAATPGPRRRRRTVGPSPSGSPCVRVAAIILMAR